MIIKGRWLFGVSAVLTAFILFGCVSEDEVKKKKVPLTWEQVARSIDYQLGEISDGTAATCAGQGLALGAGAHCKDQLQGTVITNTVIQYVEVENNPILFDSDTVFFKRGFIPVTAHPCVESMDGDSFADYTQVCAPGGSLKCEEVSDNHFRLTYTDCNLVSGTWNFDGTIDYYLSLTSLSEQSVVSRTTDFTGTDTGTGGYYIYSGDVVNYGRINPFQGTMAVGTTGTGPDGMYIVSISATVDDDGGGPDPAATFPLYFAYDFEDGYAFLSGADLAVWLSNPGGSTLVFYEAGRPWDNTGTGCLVDLSAADPLTRTFNIYTEQYGSNGCVDGDSAVPY